MKTNADLDAISDLMKSRGWQLLTDVITTDIVEAAKQFAVNPLMTEKEIDFRRGAMYAAMNFLDVPKKLRAKFEAAALLDHANELANTPATAGKE